MKTFRDTVSIRGVCHAMPALAPFINRVLDELGDYPDYELHRMVNIIVVDCTDDLNTFITALGFPLHDRSVEHIEVYPGWFELTYILSDDGFGLVVYIPDAPDVAAEVLQFCREQTGGGQQPTMSR